MIYFDTAYLLKCFHNEPNAHLVRALARQAGSVASSAHGRAEFWSGVQRHVHEGRPIAEEEVVEERERQRLPLVREFQNLKF